MADLADVETAMVKTLAAAIFPNQSYQAGAIATSTPIGAQVKLYRGWPEQGTLNADLMNGICHCTVYSEAGMTRNTTRYPLEPKQVTTQAPTIAGTVVVFSDGGNQEFDTNIDLSGSITAGDVAGILRGSAGSVAAYATVVLSADTIPAVASRLAAKIPGASSNVPGLIGIPADTLYPTLFTAMHPQSVLTEVRRQDQGIRVTCWCPTPALRDSLCRTADMAFADLRGANGNPTRFMPVAAYETAWVRYRNTYVNDFPSRDRVWKRDLCYLVEFPTTVIELDPIMLFGGGTLNSNSFGVAPPPT